MPVREVWIKDTHGQSDAQTNGMKILRIRREKKREGKRRMKGKEGRA